VASAKEIRGQIKAIQNTGKITKAMEMVAASKMRKAQDRVLDGRPYAEGIQQVIRHLMRAHPEYQHPFMIKRDVKRIGVVIVSTDKGLCGGLNTNAMKKALIVMKDSGAEVETYNIGRRGTLFSKRIGSKISAAVEDVNDSPSVEDILGVIKVGMDRFENGEIDELHLVYSHFVNTMTQTPTAVQLIPATFEKEENAGRWDYIYEPDSKIVLDGLMRRFVEARVYHGLLENKACEHSARMVAMKAATDNAKEIARDLKITYNKARQAAITQEIAEICSGAAAS